MQVKCNENRLCDLGKYNEQLQAAIDVMRQRRKEFLADMRAQDEQGAKIEKDLKGLQAYVIEELNQRERAVRPHLARTSPAPRPCSLASTSPRSRPISPDLAGAPAAEVPRGDVA